MTYPTGASPTSAPATSTSMAAYYAQRAAYYERVYFKPERQADLRVMEAWLADQFVGRQVLEIACGTGWWTPHGAARAAHWRATDLNPETMAVAQAKPAMPGTVRFQTVDAYSLAELDNLPAPRPAQTLAGPRGAAPALGRPGAHELPAPRPAQTLAGARRDRFDAAFAGCWWSHVPLARLPGWLHTLHQRLAPGATVVMLDNHFVPTSSTPISRRDAEGNTYQQRPLDDGSTHEVLKNFPTPEQAIAALGPRARDAQWIAHTHYWVLKYSLV